MLLLARRLTPLKTEKSRMVNTKERLERPTLHAKQFVEEIFSVQIFTMLPEHVFVFVQFSDKETFTCFLTKHISQDHYVITYTNYALA